MEHSTTPNALAGEASSYLRSAAHQPVRWLPWGEEAFRRAQEEDKPILMDIGAVWCHWCHVMDRESYEDPEVASLINQHYVAVKVDRDERPDIDRRYQNAVSAITGQGGWPLTAFLTPQGHVFYGGTYFPPGDGYGRPGFKTVLTRVAELYRQEKDKALRSAQALHAELQRHAQAGGPRTPLGPELVDAAVDSITRSFDVVNGGFGAAPKFPHTSAIELALARHAREPSDRLRTVITKTLEKMARGGVYDQLGGGFHRYSTDERWIVPHFEKMSYDNAALLVNYLHGYQAFGNPLFREVAEGIISYVMEVGSDRERGGFYASQDADVTMHDDGDYFTWTLKELRDTLPPEEAEVVALHYDVGEQGEMRENPAKNVLWVAIDPDAIAIKLGKPEAEVRRLLESGKRRLKAARDRRKAPFVDRTIYVSWNGMMASAFLEDYKALGREDARDLALRTIDRLMAEARASRGMYHQLANSQARHPGHLEDQVQMGQALVDAFEVTGNGRYLREAVVLADYVLDSFWDDAGGGLFDVDRAAQRLGGLDLPDKPLADSPTPGANAVAALLLLRLWHLTAEIRYRQRAQELLEAFAGHARAAGGLYAATYFLALDYFLDPPVHVVVAGPDGGAAQALHWTALHTYRPKKLVARYDGTGSPIALPAAVQGMLSSAPTGPRAYVCSGEACAPPVSDPSELEALVRTFGLGSRSRAPA